MSIHRATRADALAEKLAAILAIPLPDPFATELVVVPAKGIERWLSQTLANQLGAARGSDGICAGLEFANPYLLISRLLDTADDDPYAPDQLVWPLLATIDSTIDQPWARPLAEHLGVSDSGETGELRRGRRYALARRLAGLFSQYAVQRPTLLADWSAQREGDGNGATLPADLAWQPPLWRALTGRLATPTPVERHQATVARLRANPASFDLPARLSLFGHTRIATSELELLAALGEHRDVYVFLPHPSPALWVAMGGVTGQQTRTRDDSHHLVKHPLLATLGRDTRELQRSLQTVVATAASSSSELAEAGAEGTLLAQLQADIRANAAPTGRPWQPSDRSVQVHACHGIARQVEVAREVIVGLLADDPALEPREILLMCPDIETFAPLISAAFGAIEDSTPGRAHPAHQLAIRLADRSAGETNGLLGVVLRLLDLAGSRAEASVVLDLAALPPVRHRFRFSDDDLARLTTWVGQAGIRWGFDAEHRSDYGLAHFVHNTWQFGLDRVLAGVAMSQDSQDWIGQTLPLDDVGSAEVELVGRFTEYVARLQAVTDQLVGSHPVTHWLTTLDQALDSLTSTPTTESWQRGQLHREFGEVLAAADDSKLRLPDLRAIFSTRTAARPTRTNFRTGSLTVCTMVPMRSVPHKVVVLLGLDDGVFPRTASIDGDDVLLRNPVTGERDPRSEDRQLFLDAILAAEQTLVITYHGANEFTGQPRPPAVPLGEFLDTLNLTARTPDGRRVSEHLTVRHPLQPFDRRNHVADELGPGVFSFDATALAGAQAVERPPAKVAESMLLPPLVPTDLTVADLADFVKSPVRYFLKARLGVALPYEADEVNDRLPVEVDALTQWGVGERVLGDLLAGSSSADAKNLEWRRGVMPPGRLGWRQLQQICAQAEPLARLGRELQAGGRDAPRRAHTLDVDIDLGAGRRLRGTVPKVYGDQLIAVHYSRLGGSQRLQSWVHLLALSVHDPGRNWRAHTVGRRQNNRSNVPYTESIMGPLDHTAAATLRDLVALRDQALGEPLPIPIKSSFRYACQRRSESSAEQAYDAAFKDWKGSDRFPGERDREEFRQVFGERAALPGWLEPPRPGAEFPGETSRFGAMAMKLWSPLLDAERDGRR